MKIFLGKKSIEIKVRKVSFLGKFVGLMFSSRKKGNLLFEFRKEGRYAIHSFFVFYKFLAIWLDDKNRVLEWKVVKPFTPNISPKKPFRRLIEVPFNEENEDILKFFRR